MSVDATRWAWQQQGLRPLQKLILLSLADRADAQMQSFPSKEQLRLDTGADIKTIWQGLKALEMAGLIADSGKRAGKTQQVVVWQLVGVESRHKQPNHSEIGRVPETEGFRFSAKAFRFSQEKDSENGIRNLLVEPIKEPEERSARAPSTLPLPDWLDPSTWDAFKAHRRQIRKPMTEQAEQLNLRLLGQLRELGQDPNEVLETTIANGWTGLNWALDRATHDKGNNQGNVHAPRQRVDNSAPARIQRAYAAKWACEAALRSSPGGGDPGAVIDLGPDDYGPTH